MDRAAHVDGNRIGLFAAYRLGVDFAGRRFRSRELQPLSDVESNASLSERFPDLPAPISRRVLSEARGNPLALLELPAALSDGRLAESALRADILPLTQRLGMLYASTRGPCHDRSSWEPPRTGQGTGASTRIVERAVCAPGAQRGAGGCRDEQT